MSFVTDSLRATLLGLSLIATAGASMAQTAPAASANPDDLPPAVAGLNADALRVSKLNQQISVARKELELYQLQMQAGAMAGQTDNARKGLSVLPELVGITGINNDFVGEFLAGNAILRVRQGGWITSDWQVVTLSATEATVSKRGSAERHTLVFGGSGGGNPLTAFSPMSNP